MLAQFNADVLEDSLMELNQKLLSILLFDRTSKRNIIWATEDYADLGSEYTAESEILPELITGEHTTLIQPRISKSKEEQMRRVRDKAEVFTPSWICNQQNNLIDEAWFGRKDVFNITQKKEWQATVEAITFPTEGNRCWKKYIDAKRLEISCGEAPYLVSRYDSVTGDELPTQQRIGLLDRKLRIVNENTVTKEDWLKWAIRSIQSVYGFEFQGDSLLLARENVFLSFLEYYQQRYNELPDNTIMEQVARVISWNLWQMDGRKFVIPFSCKPTVWEETNLFETIKHIEPCPGCKQNITEKHTGLYCKIMDWRVKQCSRYIDLLKGAQTNDNV